jgi:hypothetical protein
MRKVKYLNNTVLLFCNIQAVETIINEENLTTKRLSQFLGEKLSCPTSERKETYVISKPSLHASNINNLKKSLIKNKLFLFFEPSNESIKSLRLKKNSFIEKNISSGVRKDICK